MRRSTAVILVLWGILLYAVIFAMVITQTPMPAEKESELSAEINRQAERIGELEREVVRLTPAPLIPINDNFLHWPIHLQDYRKITSWFGRRESPIYGGQYRHHKGLDIVGVPGARIVPAAAGYVSDVYPAPGQSPAPAKGGAWRGHKTKGGYIEITHPNGFQSRYSHMSYVDKKFWRIGTPVEVDDELGRQGNTGLSIKAHLHFELLRYGRHVNPFMHLEVPG